MRVFVTGASGHIGSAAVVQAMGAEVHRDGLDNLDGLRAAAAAADAVVHLAFDHQAMAGGNFGGAVATDLAVVQALGDGLAGQGKTLIGVGMRPTGDERRDAAIAANPRSAVSRAIADLGERDVHTILVAIPPVTHSARDTGGFIPQLIRIARDTGVSGYVGEGANRWPAGHTLDVAALYRLALDKAPAGAQLFAAAEEGIPVREIAETIGRHLGIPAVSIPAEEAAAHFTSFPFITLDITMPSAATREMLGWTPTHPGLLADLDEGHYFTS